MTIGIKICLAQVTNRNFFINKIVRAHVYALPLNIFVRTYASGLMESRLMADMLTCGRMLLN